MMLGIFLNILIIAIWVYVGVLSFSFYSGGKTNRFMFRNSYTISTLNIFQSVLSIYFLVTGDESVQIIRWTCFAMIEINFLQFILRSYKKRHLELLAMAFFNILVLSSIVNYSLLLNILISGTLMVLAYFSGVKILSKYFPWIFGLYAMTSIVPVIFGFTTNVSLLIGVIFSFAFMLGVVKLYHHEKVDDELKRIIKENYKNN